MNRLLPYKHLGGNVSYILKLPKWKNLVKTIADLSKEQNICIAE